MAAPLLRALHDLPAPAKLNAFLHIVGRRDDGYHLLQSAFVLIDWADTLHLERREDGQLRRHDLGPSLPPDDLCLQAARRLQSASGTSLGADIHIEKRVPWGAGMGGGSSDAATTLLALNRLWQLNWPRERLMALALALGADVPFFLGGHNAFVEGIGERVSAIDWPPTAYAVVKPAASLSTQEIFSHPLTLCDGEAAILAGSLAGVQQVANWASGEGRNDLQPAALDRCPEVAQAARWLESRFGNSRMTGSGSAVFARIGTLRTSGTVDSPMATDPRHLEGLPAGWVGRMCRSLYSHPLVGWAG